MPDLDAYLRNELRRTIRPVDVNDVSSRIDLRRAHRTQLRKIQAMALTVVVIAGTVGGVAMLSFVFRERRSAIGAASDVGNGLIVYSEVRNAGQQLWLINADGTAARQLTTGEGFSDTGPSISPDGRTVAFTRTAGHGSAIFTIGIDGTAIRQIADAPAIDPAWSPDGSRIAFERGAFGPNGIWTMNPDGSDAQLIPGTDTLDTGNPTWSPDGTSIAFEGSRPDGQGELNWDLYTVPVDATDPQDLHRLTDTPDLTEILPSWSPDGTRIAFLQFAPRLVDKSGGIAVIAADGGDAVFVTTGGPYDNNPSWSPDGSLIVFDRTSNDALSVFTIRPDGIDLTRVVDGMDPAWQPIPPGGVDSTLLPSPTPTNGGPVDLGLGFPVSNVQTKSADFDGNGTLDTAYLATKTSDVSGCPAGRAFAVLAVDLNGDGLADVSFGPPNCDVPYRLFGTPDLDGDGRADISIIQRQADSTDLITTYRLVHSGSDQAALEPFNVSDAPTVTNVFDIAWGAIPDGVAGAYCGSQEEGTYRLVVWAGTVHPDGTYALEQSLYVVTGGTFQLVTHSSDRIPQDQLPEGGGSTFCGVPVTP